MSGAAYSAIYLNPVAAGEPPQFSLPAWISCAPFEEYLGMNIEEAADGRALLTMPFLGRLSQGAGLMHGGAIVSLADTAVAMAIKTVLPEGTHFVTTELGLTFHAPVKGGMVRAVAHIAEREGRTIKGIAEIYTEEGVKAATFTSIFKVINNKKASSE